MAIAYKSQGAGAATETSGAALSPLCPSVVGAGDILIAHVYWEGTVTTPATPAGWTMLSGPHVIESTIARHWVFGKVAAGTEGGAAVSFGNPSVTTQRGARIYSFSGRVSGTITELAQSFAHISHSTDPQMPTVTTSQSGALAVALVAQNDNNTAGAATGATGGTWAEPVAEYVAALTPGLMLQIQTCAPISNPGAVTGGSVATANDPCGVVAFEIRPSGATAQVVLPDNATLALVGYAPAVLTPATVSPPSATISLTGYAPSVAISDNVVAYPGAAALTLAGFAPAVVIDADVIVTPAPAALTLTGHAPSALTPIVATPASASATLAGFAPTVAISAVAAPASAALTLTGFAPTVVAPQYSSCGTPFLYTAANWSVGTVFVLEGYFRAVSGSVAMRLYDITSLAPVDGSETIQEGTLNTRLRTPALTLIDGHEYSVQMGAYSAGASGAVVGAHLIAA